MTVAAIGFEREISSRCVGGDGFDSFSEVLAEQRGEFGRAKNLDGLAFDFNEALLAKLGERARERLAHGAEFGYQHAFGHGQLDVRRSLTGGIGATFDELVGQAGFDILEGPVFELTHQDAQMNAH